MARRKKEAQREANLDLGDQLQEESTGSKAITVLIVFIIVIIWLAVFGVLIKLDVGGFGSQVLTPVLKDIPVINKILPNSGVDDYSDKYNFNSMSDAVERIQELERQLAAATDTKSANDSEIKELKAEVERLKVFENEQADFAERVKEFDEKVVFADAAPDIEEYKTFYEGISPDNAEQIYKQVVEKMEYSQKIKDQAEIYSKMEPEKAAAVFETMTGDLDLLASILDNMSQSKSALILQNMSAESAAQISKKMTLK